MKSPAELKAEDMYPDEWQDGTMSLRAAFKEGWEADKWIAVETQTPEYETEVILFHDHGNNHKYSSIGIWDEEQERFHKMNCITHWQPAPKHPNHD